VNVVPGISLLAVSVVDCPVHIDVDPEKLMTGAGFTVIVADAIFLHPLDSVAVTTYVVVDEGLTAILEVVPPLDQTYEVYAVAFDTIIVAGPPFTHRCVFPARITGVLLATITVRVRSMIQPLPEYVMSLKQLP
jgi:hypothetical protein